MLFWDMQLDIEIWICIIPSSTNLRRDIVTLPSFRNILVNTRINILQWILTKLGTYLVLQKIWNPVYFQGQRSRSLKFLPHNILVNTRINILQWILTKHGTYLVLQRIWNPIDFQGQRSRSPGQIFRRGNTPRFALPLFGFLPSDLGDLSWFWLYCSIIWLSSLRLGCP